MDLQHLITSGHLTKVFDPSRRIPAEIISELLEFLRTSASSENIQPWHFVVACNDQDKAQVNRGVLEANRKKVSTASHVILFCTRQTVSDQYIEAIVEQADKAGRFNTPRDRVDWRAGAFDWINMHRYDTKDLTHWLEKQTYFALGMFLMAATELGLDVAPLEGIDPRILDEEFGLRAKGFRSSVLVALGYRSQNDWNIGRPKPRHSPETIFTFLSGEKS